MFGKAVNAGVALGLFKKLAEKRSQTVTQSATKKKKKKPAAGRGGIRARRGGAGKRSLLDVS